MPDINAPRRGSLQYWPRKRARRGYARIKSKPKIKETKLLGFAGYKVGMTHVLIEDTRPTSLTKNENVMWPVTVIECPPLKTHSIRFYQQTTDGLKLVSEIFSKNVTKDLLRKVRPSKKETKEPENFDEIRLVVYTQPRMTGIGQKKPQLFEIGIGGSDKKQQLEYAKQLLGKEIKINDIFKTGQFVDVHTITKGKGFQGAVKRFGVRILQHKAEKKKRGIASLGSWKPKRVDFRVAQPGKMGFHQRTEYNKLLLKIGHETKEINPEGGFKKYGQVKNDYLLIKGSVGGPQKRLVIMTEAVRPKSGLQQLEIGYTSLESKQGR
ncbi:MAG: 50S ribosomal protein L3 [Candidatus Nanoarchaeia archaeon]